MKSIKKNCLLIAFLIGFGQNSIAHYSEKLIERNFYLFIEDTAGLNRMLAWTNYYKSKRLIKANDKRRFTGTPNYIPKYSGAETFENSIIYDNGTMIGIGTTNPAYLFDVKGTTRIGGTASVIGNALEIWNLGSNIFSFNNSGAVDFFVSGLRIGPGTIGSVGSNLILKKNDDTKYMSFNNALYLAPTTNNVLINTTVDNGYKLDVRGSTYFGYNSGNNRSLLFNGDNNTIEDVVLASTTSSAGGSTIGFRYAPTRVNSGRHKGFVVSFPKILFSNSDNVGFEIDATVGSTANITGVRSVVKREGGTNAKISYAGYFSAANDNGRAYGIYSALGLNHFMDNVGIGVVIPLAKLHTNGTIRFQGLVQDNMKTRILVTDENGDIAYRDISSLGSGGGGTINGSPSYLAKYLSPTEIVNSSVYETDGNVGIGTTTPGTYKLAVEGIIGARKVRVHQNSWADYVFADDYKLPKLSEVEKFIKTNKHLPDVPSAKEVEKDGLDLGDNQAVLLKKIEELTLYIIDLEKRIQQLEKK